MYQCAGRQRFRAWVMEVKLDCLDIGASKCLLSLMGYISYVMDRWMNVKSEDDLSADRQRSSRLSSVVIITVRSTQH